MSNKKHAKPATAEQTLDALCHVRIPHGCRDCGAFIQVQRGEHGYSVGVYHDPGCPFHAGVTR